MNTRRLVSLLFVVTSILLPNRLLAQGRTFDLSRMRPLTDDHKTPAEDRIATGIQCLEEELANPSEETWGMVAGPIDSGYIQGVIAGTIAFPGAEAPQFLRKKRDEAKDLRLKDLLTIALARTGAQDTIPDVARIAVKDPEGNIRTQAMVTLWNFTLTPAPTDNPLRVRPGEVWHPLNAKALKVMADTFVAGLQDTFARYMGDSKDEQYAFYPVQRVSGGGLARLGFNVQPTNFGYRVLDSKKKLVCEVKVKTKIANRQGTKIQAAGR